MHRPAGRSESLACRRFATRHRQAELPSPTAIPRDLVTSFARLSKPGDGPDHRIGARRVRPLLLEFTFARGDAPPALRRVEARIHGLKRAPQGSNSASPIASRE